MIFKYYSIAKITFRIILVLSQINPKMIQVVKSHGPSGPETRAEWSAGRDVRLPPRPAAPVVASYAPPTPPPRARLVFFFNVYFDVYFIIDKDNSKCLCF